MAARMIAGVRPAASRSDGAPGWLSVPDGDQTLYLIGLEGPMFMDTGWRSGTSVPIGASSAGRVLMAFFEPERCERLLNLPVPPLTKYTVRNRAQLEKLVTAEEPLDVLWYALAVSIVILALLAVRWLQKKN